MPSSPSGSPANFYSKSQKDVLDEVQKGAPLKPTNTADKSKPQISGMLMPILIMVLFAKLFLIMIAGDVKVKKVDRKPFLNEVKQDHELNHVDKTADRSEPSIFKNKEIKIKN